MTADEPSPGPSATRTATRLLAESRMQPSGPAPVEQAEASGMGDAMNDVDALLVPPDLTAAPGLLRPAAKRES